MKRLPIYLFILFLFCLLSCDKDDLFLVPQNEVPQWLQERIETDLDIIATDPTKAPNFGAWKEYTFMDQTFYQYDNPLSSLCCEIYNEDGESLSTEVAPYTNFEQDKCCERLIWKGDKYSG